MEQTRAINKCLYQARLKKKETLKDAAKALGIFKIRLDLIEKGYLSVSKKLQSKFIEHYKLGKDFFKTHSTYIDPINTHEDDDKAILKFRQIVSAKPVRIITAALSIVGASLLACGIYFGNKVYSNPREAWSENYAKFKEGVVNNKETKTSFDALIGDSYYFYDYTDETYNLETKVYKSDLNSSDTAFLFEYFSNDNYYLKFDISCYNKRIVALTSYDGKYNGKRLVLDDVSCFIEGNNFNLRPFKYHYNYEPGKAKKGDEIYNEIKKKVDKDLNETISLYNKEVLGKNNFAYQDIRDTLVDVRKISRDYVFNFNLGYDLKMAGGITFGVALSCLILSFIIKPKFKFKEKEKPAVKFSLASVSLPARDLPNDTKLPLVIPEFVLRIIGLAIILFFVIGLNVATYWRINVDLIHMSDDVKMLKEVSSNLFVAGTTLLFFLKLDVYHKKTQKDLLTNIFILFIIGLIYYVMEVVLYTSVQAEFMKNGGIFNALMSILTTFLPGNIIWNLMLYSCIFYFLFVTPKKYQNSPHKIIRFRLLSLIPTLFLLIAFIYKIFIEPVAPAPYFISCIFFTKGILITLFAITYLYALYFLQTYYRFRFGEETAKIYFYSRRFAFMKNLTASIIIVVLFLIDIFFMLKMPDNKINLGNNWAIILIAPFILFYRPHIGKRNAKWDTAFLLLYLFFFVGGFVSVISQITSLFDFTQLAEIIN